MKKLLLGLLVIGLTSPVFSQIVELPEIEITAVNYKYLSAVNSQDLDLDVKMLQEKVAHFDLKNADFYEDEYNMYEVRFYIPKGAILVAYDKNGEIIRTIERFKNVKLPLAVRNTISTAFPGWALTKDVYRVSYRNNKSNKVYKVILEKVGQVLRVKIDEKGTIIGDKSSKIEL